MKLNVIGKSAFTEDGFTPEEFQDNRHLYKALQKVLGEEALYNRKTEIIGAGLNSHFCPCNIITYVDGMDSFTDSETFLKNFNKDYIFPKISGIVWNKADDINVVGYTDCARIFLTFESTYSDYIALLIMSGSEIRDNMSIISGVIDKYFTLDCEITITGHDNCEDDMSELNKLLYSVNDKIKWVTYGTTIDDFEMYSDRSDPKNHTLTIIP